MLFQKVLPKVVISAALLVAMAGCAAAPSALAQVSSNPSASSTGQSQANSNPSASALGANAGAVASPPTQVVAGSGQGITVTGIGTVTGSPDMVQVSVGVVTQGTTVQDAVNANQTQMNALLAAVKALGIADSDIQTSNFNVSTQNNVKPGAPGAPDTTSVTYFVNNQVNVILHDVSKLSDLLDKVVSAGANNIYGVNFGISNPSHLQDQARAKAVQDASNRAQSLAKLEGITLGNVISVTETNGYPGVVYPSAAGLGGGGTPIQPGQLQVSVSLQVTYAIK